MSAVWKFFTVSEAKVTPEYVQSEEANGRKAKANRSSSSYLLYLFLGASSEKSKAFMRLEFLEEKKIVITFGLLPFMLLQPQCWSIICQLGDEDVS